LRERQPKIALEKIAEVNYILVPNRAVNAELHAQLLARFSGYVGIKDVLIRYIAGLRLYQKEHQRQKQKEHQHALRCSSDYELNHATDFLASMFVLAPIRPLSKSGAELVASLFTRYTHAGQWSVRSLK